MNLRRGSLTRYVAILGLSEVGGIIAVSWYSLVLGMLLLSGCGFPAWRDQSYRDLMAGRLTLDPAQVGSGGSPTRYLDFYDRSGRRLGYGVVRDGRVDLYGQDGRRVGYGRSWR